MKCVCTLNKVCEPQDEHIYAVVCPPTLSWDTDSKFIKSNIYGAMQKVCHSENEIF